MKLNKNLLIVLFLFIIILISYANIFPNNFAWDDEFFIVNNIHIRDLSNIPGFFTEPSPGFLYRPLRSVFYTLTYQIWGLNVFGYHLNSLLLHFFVSLLLFFITLKITKKTTFSLVVSLFFAVHPIHTARITNMTATFDVLGILFLLLAFFSYIIVSTNNEKIKIFSSIKSINFLWNTKNYYYLSIVFYLLALFSSEEALTLILFLFLYDFTFNFKINLNNFKSSLKKYIPYIVITIFYLIIRFSVLRQIGRTDIYFEHSFFGTLLTTIKIFVQYIIILFFPFNLTIERVVKFDTTILSIGFLISLFISLFILFFFIKSYKKSKIVFFSIGWFFITLLPFSNIFPQITIMADRYLYLPSYGFVLLLTFLIFKFNKIDYIKKISKVIIVVLVILIMGMYSFLTIQKNAEWKDNFNLLSTSVEKGAGTKTYNSLALYYRERGDYENALTYASKAVDLSSKNYNAYENLGTINAYLENYDKAISFYNKAIELSPDFYLANNNLGLVYSYINDYDNSLIYLKKSIDINPKLSKAYSDLGTVYGGMGKFDLAVKEINKAIEINPYESDYYYNLAVIYEFLKDEDKAKDLLVKALEIEPKNEKIKNKLNNLK
ncbi:MAG: tetratricopeptide repeat protein [Nanoarchaeota archaeon]|nr:tetratricopeptide repeat protein [Nanoarchaeota archaeon]